MRFGAYEIPVLKVFCVVGTHGTFQGFAKVGMVFVYLDLKPCFLKNEMALLELGLSHWAMAELVNKYDVRNYTFAMLDYQNSKLKVHLKYRKGIFI